MPRIKNDYVSIHGRARLAAEDAARRNKQKPMPTMQCKPVPTLITNLLKKAKQ